MIRLKASAGGVLAGMLMSLSAAAPTAAQEPHDTRDACEERNVPEDGFDDVPDSNVHEAAIDCAIYWSLALGRTRDIYAPEAPLTRGQLATFVVNLLAQSGDTLSGDSEDHFDDDDESVHEKHINLLAERSIVSGRTQTAYDPNGLAPRDHIAAVLVRAIEHRTVNRLPASADYFTDDHTSVHERAINAAAEAGLVTGTSHGRYEPSRPVQRDQVASILVRALDLLIDAGYGNCIGDNEYPLVMRIIQVQADPPGADVQSGAGEYVELRNDRCDNVALKGWYLRDADGNVLTVPDGYLLRPQQTMRVYTGPGQDTADRYYAGRDREVWDNAGDTATLHGPHDAEVDRYSY